jgi:putative peptidoglycan lipid II flippase
LKDNSEQSRRILKQASTVTIFTLFSRILGAARDLVIAHVFGAGWITDAFVQAFTIPNVMRRLTAEGSMTLVFLPLYTEIRDRKNPEAAKKFAAKTLALVLASTTILTGLGIIFSPQLVFLFAAGFASSPEKYELTVLLTRVMFPYLIFVSLVAWAMGVLNAEGRFAEPAAAPILLNISIICSAFGISPLLDEPIIGIGIGVLLGGISQIILQIPSLRKVGQSLKPSTFFNDENINRLLKLLGPSLLGVAVYQINIIVLRNLASFMPSGQVTHYYNASRLSELTLGVFAFALTTASFPELSRHTASENWDKIRSTLRFTMSTTLLVVFPATVGLAIAAEPIVAMLYLHGAYVWSDVQNTAHTLQAFALSIPAVAMIRLQTSLFYSLKDTHTPVKVSLFSILLTGLLGWWLSQSLEIFGLALGLAAGTWFQWGLLTFFLLNETELRKRWWPLRSFLLYLLASGGMAVFTWFASGYGFWEKGPFIFYNWIVFLALLTGSTFLYLSLLIIFREEQVLKMTNRFKSTLMQR